MFVQCSNCNPNLQDLICSYLYCLLREYGIQKKNSSETMKVNIHYWEETIELSEYKI